MVPTTDFQIPKTHHSESLDHYTRLIAGGSRHTVSWEVPGALHTRISSCDYRTITSKTCTAVYVASSSSGTIKSEGWVKILDKVRTVLRWEVCPKTCNPVEYHLSINIFRHFISATVGCGIDLCAIGHWMQMKERFCKLRTIGSKGGSTKSVSTQQWWCSNQELH